nr:hypothetical protein [Pedococcus badiiscoriae]
MAEVDPRIAEVEGLRDLLPVTRSSAVRDASTKTPAALPTTTRP